MKWLLGLLVVVNLAYFAWGYSHSEASTAARNAPFVATDPGVRPLVLLSEAGRALNPPPSPAPQTTADPVPAVVSVPTTCITLGPLASNDLAGEISGLLAGHNLAAHPRSNDVTTTAYGVRIALVRAPQSAERRVQHLHSAGIADVMVEHNDVGYLITAGVFATQAEAVSRIAELRLKGVIAVVAPRNDTRSEFWLDLDASAGATLPDPVATALQQRFPNVKQQPRACGETPH